MKSTLRATAVLAVLLCSLSHAFAAPTHKSGASPKPAHEPVAVPGPKTAVGPKIHLIHIRMLTTDGKPIAGASVVLMARYPGAWKLGDDPSDIFMSDLVATEGPQLPSWAGDFRPPATDPGATGKPARLVSAADGSVAIAAGVDGDTLLLFATADGFQSMPVTLDVPFDDGLKVRMLPGVSIHGRLVRDDTGDPVPGAVLHLSTKPLRSYTTDASGEFHITGVGDEICFVELNDDNLVAQPKQIVPTRGEAIDIGDIKVGSGCLLTGKATVATSGEIIRKVQVVVTNAMDTTRNASNWVRKSEESNDGTYSIRLPAGHFRIAVTSRGAYKVAFATATITPADKAMTQNFSIAKHDYRSSSSEDGLPDPRNRIAGVLLRADTKAPIPGADIRLAVTDNDVRKTTTDATGHFAFDGLVDSPPQDSYYKNYVVAAYAPHCAITIATVQARGAETLSMYAGPGQSVSIRVVGTDSKPIEGVLVTPAHLQCLIRRGRLCMLMNVPAPLADSDMEADATSADGKVSFDDVPDNAYLEVKLTHPGYSDADGFVATPRVGMATLRIWKQSKVTGSVYLGDDTPLTQASLGILLSPSGYMSLNSKYSADTDSNGHYEFANLPSLESIGKSGLRIAFTRGSQTVGSLHASVDQVHQGESALVTVPDGPKAGVWYARSNVGPAVSYDEGAVCQHDIHLMPMAVIKGQVVSDAAAPVTFPTTVSDYEQRNGYSPMQITTATDGTFQIVVAPGDVKLHVGSVGFIVLKDVKPLETRTVTLHSAYRDQEIIDYDFIDPHIRFVTADGSSVAGAPFSFHPLGDVATSGRLYCDLDGNATVGVRFDEKQIVIDSPCLDAPVTLATVNMPEWPLAYTEFTGLTAGEMGAELTPIFPPTGPLTRQVIVSRLPDPVARDRDRVVPQFGADTVETTPPMSSVGDPAPELEAVDWGNVTPVKLADLHGSVVILDFRQDQTESLAYIARQYQGRSLKIIRLNVQPPFADFAKANEPDSVSTGLDASISDSPALYYNAIAFGSSDAVAIIAPDGTIAAEGLNGASLIQAKADALLSQSDN